MEDLYACVKDYRSGPARQPKGQTDASAAIVIDFKEKRSSNYHAFWPFAVTSATCRTEWRKRTKTPTTSVTVAAYP
jgi:hypothetical protein